MQTPYYDLDDQALIALILPQPTDWHEMLSILLQRHHRSLLARCHAYLRNREDAEDAAQETELRAFRAINSFRQDASFRTWLFAIGDRQCHDLARKRSRNMLSEHLRSMIEIHLESTSKVTSVVESDETVDAILSGLSRSERDVLVLRFYLDLSLQEIATYLGIGLSATKMRLYRSLELFEAMLMKQRRLVASR